MGSTSSGQAREGGNAYNVFGIGRGEIQNDRILKNPLDIIGNKVLTHPYPSQEGI
jgi:hypothetical protein